MNLQQQILVKMVERDRYPYPRYSLRLHPIGLKGEIQNRSELFKFVMLAKDACVRVFSNYQIAEREYDIIDLDIDDHDLRFAMVKLHAVLERLHHAAVFNYFLTFSGSKGWHVYIPFEPVRLLQFRKTVIAWLLKHKILDFVDHQAIEPNRNMRLPSTINTKSGFHCVTLGNKLKHTYKEILDMSVDNELVDFDIIPNPDLGKELLNIDGGLVVEHSAYKHSPMVSQPTDSIMFKNLNEFPPCMRRLTMLANDGIDLNHVERLELGKFQLHVHGDDVDKVAKYYSKMSDYNVATTKYQLKYMIKNNQQMSTCQHLDDHGICCENKNICPFYPSLNTFIRRDNKLKSEKLKHAK
jgi:hypothetical protein